MIFAKTKKYLSLMIMTIMIMTFIPYGVYADGENVDTPESLRTEFIDAVREIDLEGYDDQIMYLLKAAESIYSVKISKAETAESIRTLKQGFDAAVEAVNEAQTELPSVRPEKFATIKNLAVSIITMESEEINSSLSGMVSDDDLTDAVTGVNTSSDLAGIKAAFDSYNNVPYVSISMAIHDAELAWLISERELEIAQEKQNEQEALFEEIKVERSEANAAERAAREAMLAAQEARDNALLLKGLAEQERDMALARLEEALAELQQAVNEKEAKEAELDEAKALLDPLQEALDKLIEQNKEHQAAVDKLKKEIAEINNSRTLSKPVWKSVKAKKKVVILKWKKVAYAKGYEIFRSTKKKGSYQLIKTVKKQSAITFKDKKVKKKKTYFYKIRAYGKNGKANIISAFSKVKKIKVK